MPTLSVFAPKVRSTNAAPGGPHLDPPGDDEVIRALRAGDEAVFETLVKCYGDSLLRAARGFVRSDHVAEEVVQDTWMRLVGSLERFEGRSSLKTWLFGILINVARNSAHSERRSAPLSSLVADDPNISVPTAAPERFRSPDDPSYPSGWVSFPKSWEGIPEERLLSSETRGVVTQAVKELPPRQAIIITLRDVEGWPAAEVCELLDLSEANQRVLLHRARSLVRRRLEIYLDED